MVARTHRTRRTHATHAGARNRRAVTQGLADTRLPLESSYSCPLAPRRVLPRRPAHACHAHLHVRPLPRSHPPPRCCSQPSSTRRPCACWARPRGHRLACASRLLPAPRCRRLLPPLGPQPSREAACRRRRSSHRSSTRAAPRRRAEGASAKPLAPVQVERACQPALREHPPGQAPAPRRHLGGPGR